MAWGLRFMLFHKQFCPQDLCPHYTKATKYRRKCWYGEPQCWRGWIDMWGHFVPILMRELRIVNFMVVGAIGYIINMGIYYPLTLVFQNDVTFLGQHFYLPPFLLSSLVAITSNYYWNKKWTFGDMKAKPLSYWRYLSMASATLVLDMVVLWGLVDFGKLSPVVAAAIAIIFVFILRYFISKHWVWHGS